MSINRPCKILHCLTQALFHTQGMKSTPNSTNMQAQGQDPTDIRGRHPSCLGTRNWVRSFHRIVLCLASLTSSIFNSKDRKLDHFGYMTGVGCYSIA